MDKRHLSNRRGFTKRRLLLRKTPQKNSRFGAKANGKGGNSTFRPEWTGALEGYTVRIINKNLWRFHTVMEFDDAYQEAYIKFLELRDRYAGSIDSPKWFMALYKTSLANRITDFSNQANKYRRQIPFSDLMGDFTSNGEVVPAYEDLLKSDSDTEMEYLFEAKLENPPTEVRQVLSLMIHSRPDMLDAITESWFDRGKRKEDGNQFLCSLLGYDHRQVDLVGRVQDYLEDIL